MYEQMVNEIGLVLAESQQWQVAGVSITIVQLSDWSDAIPSWRLPSYFFSLLAIAVVATAVGGLAILNSCLSRYETVFASGAEV